MDDRISGLVKKTLKCQCPFRLIGRLIDDGWRVTVIDDTHNHYATENLESYAYARRLTEDERSFLEDEYHRSTTPRKMLKLLKERFPGNLTRSEDIYNFQKAMRRRRPKNMGTLQCRVHIWRNIDKFSMPSLKGEGKRGHFYGWWKKLYESRTLEEYTKNEKDLKEKMGPRLDKVYKYLQKEWLFPYKEKFMSFWVDQHLNYCNYTTNIVEAEHSLLKSELQGRCTFQRIIQCVNDILLGQDTEIKGQLEESRIYRAGKHNYPCLKDLLCVVSVTALDIMVDEIKRLKNEIGKDLRKCGCKVWISCGLPCACRLAAYRE
uniref:uncharacterized protein LOC122591630 n=1 Tax=Erigeron canadensis TaxID=72917 RepID=UPI001CB9C072|nr:uncharacterized protein LOC122591630 [Erigeron canadensis]